jgi:hypothetical protein
MVSSEHVVVGFVIAEPVSHRLLTAVASIQSQVRSYGIYGGQCGTEVGFLQVFLFPLPILIPPTPPHLLINLSLMLYSLNMDSVAEQLTKKHTLLNIVDFIGCCNAVIAVTD